VAQFNAEDPRHQREQQKAAAKRSMGPQRLARADIGEISGRHAGYQLGRQQLFGRLGTYGKGRDIAHELALATAKQGDRRLNLLESNLDRDKKALGLTTGFGLLGMGLSTLEGNKRKKLLEQSGLEQQLFRNRLLNMLAYQKQGKLIGGR
jgi:hypothetical protein